MTRRDRVEPCRLAVLTTHPVQYQAPLLRRIAGEPDIDLTVFYESDFSLRRFVDTGFQAEIAWDVPLIGGYRHEVLPFRGAAEPLDFWRPRNHGLGRRLRAGRFDALLVHGYARWHHLQAMALARSLGLKVLLRDEATGISAARGPGKRFAKRVFFGLLDGIVDHFMAIGTRNAAYYRANGIGAHKIVMMPYAVDNGFFDAPGPTPPADIRARHGIPDGRRVILFAGKFQPRKHPLLLLDAFDRLVRDGWGDRLHLLMIGDGEQRPEIERRAAGRPDISLTGFKGQRELVDYLHLCDVFVLPSVREPWGLAVNEAMAAGRAVVVCDEVGCAPDLVRQGENGFVVPAGDAAALAEALAAVFSTPDRAAMMGDRGRRIIAGWDFEADIQGLRQALFGAVHPTEK